MKPVFFIPCLFVLFCSCGGNGDTKNIPAAGNAAASTQQDSSSGIVPNFTAADLQQRITDTLMQLSFVKESDHYIDSISDHKKGMAFITDTTGPGISVMAGYNGEERFETYYHFYIHPESFEIEIMDPVTGDLIPLADYTRNKGQQ